MKKLLILIIVSIFLLSCVTTTNSTKTDDFTLSTNEYSIQSFERNENGYLLIFSTISDSVPDNAKIHIRVGNSGEAKDYKKGTLNYQFGYLNISETGTFDLEFGIGIPEGNQIKVRSTLLFKDTSKADIENNFPKSDGRSDGHTNQGEFVFIYPDIEHDLSMNPDPPVGFEKREGEKGIGIVDFKYNKSIWIYGDMTLEQIHTIMPDAEQDGRVFHLSDGGFVIINFDKNGKLSQFYPRLTNRFTLIGFPQLPWSMDTVSELFGKRGVREMTGNESTVFVGVKHPDLNGFRIDSKDYKATGFRIWHPTFQPSGQ